MRFLLIPAVALGFVSTSCVSHSHKPIPSVTVQMMPAAQMTGPMGAKGKVILLTMTDGGIELRGTITGLNPGMHGLHIHEKGICSDSDHGFQASGGHFNPDQVHHGSLLLGHAGDLGNIVADQDGVAHFDIETTKFNIIPGDPYSVINRSLIVHVNADDENTNPAGNSGNRILCGVIAD